MSKSLIYTANTSTQTLNVNGIVNLGTTVRRFGPNLSLSGNAIQIAGAGYYKINAAFVCSPSEIGDVTITAYLNNTPIQGAIASGSVAAANDFITLPINTVVREGCQCCEGLSNLTFVLTGISSEVSNVSLTVTKE